MTEEVLPTHYNFLAFIWAHKENVCYDPPSSEVSHPYTYDIHVKKNYFIAFFLFRILLLFSQSISCKDLVFQTKLFDYSPI